MRKMSRQDAEELAAQVCEALRPQILKVVADLLAGEDEDGLTPEERAKVDRTVAALGRTMGGKQERAGGARKAG